MISAIIEIGKYLRENNGISDNDIINNLVTPIKGDNIKEILLINFNSNETISIKSEEFYSAITTKALFYQAGNYNLGCGIRADYFKEDESNKFDKKIKATLSYCGKEDEFESVKEIIYKKIKESGKNFFITYLFDDKYPIDLFKDKFLDNMYSDKFKLINGKHICHFCGEEGEVYNTTSFKFYTNDKAIYGSINDKNKFGVTVCKDCLNDILLGKKYVEDKMTAYWMDQSVMFLPHDFNEITAGIYESSSISDDKHKSFISNISNNESLIFEMLGEGTTETDIVFFEKEAEKTFYIYHTIKSMLPSRFTEIASYLNKYNLNFYNVIRYSTAIKVGLKGIETTPKEKIRIVDSVFYGKRIERNLFFKRAMLVYKNEYLNDKSRFTINNIGKVYNFLVDCSCLKGGFDIMRDYNNYEELFLENEKYFNTNEKKAWFLVGNIYSYINYKIKQSNSGEDGKIADRSSLDKNFFFARKFGFKDFIYFTNLLDDKVIKYRINSKWIKDNMSEAKILMSNSEGKLSSDEAKYIFFWGMDMHFKKEEKVESEV